jgi:hypothetical protein
VRANRAGHLDLVAARQPRQLPCHRLKWQQCRSCRAIAGTLNVRLGTTIPPWGASPLLAEKEPRSGSPLGPPGYTMNYGQ